MTAPATHPDRPHPGPARATLRAAIRDALVAYARAELPNEACGLISGTAPAADGGVATRWHPTRNRASSPLRYEIHPDDLLHVSLAIDDADEVTWGIVHSHVRSAARPSPADVGQAHYPDALYLLVSLAAAEANPVTGAGGVPFPDLVAGPARFVPDPATGPARQVPDPAPGAESVRAWRIVEGAIFEVVLDMEAEVTRDLAPESG